MRLRWRSLAAIGTAGCLLSGAAAAQQEDWQFRDDNRVDRQMGAQPEGQWRTFTADPALRGQNLFLVHSDAQRQTTITVENGRVIAADIDGRTIGPHQVQRRADTIRVVDDQNNTVARFELPQRLLRPFGGQRFGVEDPWMQRDSRFIQRDRFDDRPGMQRDPWTLERERFGTFPGSDVRPMPRDRFDTRDRFYTEDPWAGDRLDTQDRFYTDDRFDGRDRFEADRTFGIQERDRLALRSGDPELLLGVETSRASAGELRQTEYTRGLAIDRIMTGGAADIAGLDTGDIIVAANGRTPLTEPMLRRELADLGATETVRLTIVRDGTIRAAQVRGSDLLTTLRFTPDRTIRERTQGGIMYQDPETIRLRDVPRR